MGSFSIWHWMVVLLVVLLLFGGGKVSSLMGDFAKGIKSFKKNMAEETTPRWRPAPTSRRARSPARAPRRTPPAASRPRLSLSGCRQRRSRLDAPGPV